MTPALAASVFERLGDELWLLVPAFLFSLIAAALVGRILGVRRSFAATAFTALFGWVVGVVVALLVADRHVNASDNFARNLFLFTLFGAMAAAVWIEFLARPGMIVRAQTGLQSIPHPLRSARLRSRQVRRYAEITRIAVRNGLGPSLGLGRGGGADGNGVRPPTVRRLRLALEECGGMFVKLGQVMSTRSDLISPDAAAELALLQDEVRPADREGVEELLELELDAPCADVFSSFDWQPLAAASIGQVYRAQLPDGSPVIVKVQRPGVGETVQVDLSVLEELGRVAESRTSWGSEYHVKDLVDEFGARLREELDYRIEARNAETIAASLPPGSRMYVPHVYEELSTSRVLVMEWLDGVDVRRVAWSEARPSDRTKVADQLLPHVPRADAAGRRVPRRPAPRQRDAALRRPARADRLRRRRASRPRPAGRAARHDGGRHAARRRRGRTGGAPGRAAAPRGRRRRLRAGAGPLHGAAPRAGRQGRRRHAQRDAPAVLRVRDHPAGGVEHLLPRPHRARGHAHHDRARTTR